MLLEHKSMLLVHTHPIVYSDATYNKHSSERCHGILAVSNSITRRITIAAADAIPRSNKAQISCVQGTLLAHSFRMRTHATEQHFKECVIFWGIMTVNNSIGEPRNHA